MEDTALLIIDEQNDYFSGGKMALPGAESAGQNTAKLLGVFRQRGLPIVHIQHTSLQPDATFFLPETEGQKIHLSVAPRPGEIVIGKNWPNSFKDTDLLARLQKLGVKHLIITGMMTMMCVDATTRAAFDLGFECTLVHDATAAPPLEFNGVSVSAEQVKAAFIAALAFLVKKVVSVDELVEDLAQ